VVLLDLVLELALAALAVISTSQLVLVTPELAVLYP
jgi:hypothetical protein